MLLPETSSLVTGDMLRELCWAKSFLQNATPRVFRAGMRLEKFLIFTDAALEQSDTRGSVGMVAFSMNKGRGFFAEEVPESDMSREFEEEGGSCP